MTPMSAIPLRKTVHYPDSDGQPMADNDLQYRVMTDLRHALDIRYDAEPDVYVSADLLIYYVEGDPGARVAPDVFVAFGVPKGMRRSYRVWEEGHLPDVVFEIASHTGWRKLLGSKKDLYQEIGFPEYIVFDPDGEFIQPRLQGFRLQNGRYWPIPLEPDGSLLSRITGLRLEPEGMNLRVVDPVTGRRYPWAKESEARAQKEAAARQAAEERAVREAAARQAAEERARALEEELARLRAELGQD
jgi:Uma2 family endonuclease